MQKEYKAITGGLTESLGKMHKGIPDVMKAFSVLATTASADGALDAKTKEFIALAIGISSHCDGCIGFHTKKLVQLGASRCEIEEVLGVSVYMGGGPSLMYAADALRAYEEFSQ